MQKQAQQGRALLHILVGLYVAILLLSNILAIKILGLGPLIFDGGTILFPLSYIFGDILTEVYGYKVARSVIWTGIASLALMTLSIYAIYYLPAIKDWPLDASFRDILVPLPRIALASICGCFAGEYCNSVVLSRMKIWTKGRHLWSRTIGSTLVGELADTLVFVLLAFSFTYTAPILLAMIISNYVFKCAVEILFTPLTYKVVAYVKKREGLDTFDHGQRYNPLPVN